MSSEENSRMLVLDYVGDVGLVGITTLWISGKAVKTSKAPDGVCIGIMGPEVLKKLGGSVGKQRVNSVSNPLEMEDAEGPSLDEYRVLREEDVRGVESDLVDSFEEGEIRDDSVLYNDGCIRICMENEFENSIIGASSTPPGNDLNIVVESGSSWIDYIGPLTSDEIDSDKRWSYRDPNGNIHGLFSLAQLRSWKDYFPSDLQIWSYYGNVKEAILLHNALSRQTKDAG
ncbi:zinc finger CCCH domain-containing protein 19 [Tanacetum coccineum]